jgi:hypothetical protein
LVRERNSDCDSYDNEVDESGTDASTSEIEVADLDFDNFADIQALQMGGNKIFRSITQH